MELDAQFRQAVAAYKAGDKDQARDLLLDVVDKDERHEQAWLYLSALVGTLDEQQICLENVLAINPDNQRAKKGLEKVNQQIAARDQSAGAGTASQVADPHAPPQSLQSSSPPQPDDVSTAPFSSVAWDSMPSPSNKERGSGSAPIGAEFGGASGDSLMDQEESIGFPSFDSLGSLDERDDMSGVSMDWLKDAPTPAAPQEPEALDSSSSVDWGNADAPTAYGSGKDVDLPSRDQYDDWVQGLNISSDDPIADQPEVPDLGVVSEPEEPAGFSMPSDASFGETGYMLDDDAMATDIPAGDDRAQNDRGASGSAYEDGEAGAEDEPASFGATVMYDEPFAKDDDEDDLVFSFEDELPSTEGTGSGAATATAAPASAYGHYFAMIPDEIHAKGGGGRRVLMLLGIVLLVALNAASFAMLLM